MDTFENITNVEISLKLRSIDFKEYNTYDHLDFLKKFLHV